MAQKLGIQCLAEGIETEEQLAFLREIGCPLGQGYLYPARCRLPASTPSSRAKSAARPESLAVARSR